MQIILTTLLLLIPYGFATLFVRAALLRRYGYRALSFGVAPFLGFSLFATLQQFSMQALTWFGLTVNSLWVLSGLLLLFTALTICWLIFFRAQNATLDTLRLEKADGALSYFLSLIFSVYLLLLLVFEAQQILAHSYQIENFTPLPTLFSGLDENLTSPMLGILTLSLNLAFTAFIFGSLRYLGISKVVSLTAVLLLHNLSSYASFLQQPALFFVSALFLLNIFCLIKALSFKIRKKWRLLALFILSWLLFLSSAPKTFIYALLFIEFCLLLVFLLRPALLLLAAAVFLLLLQSLYALFQQSELLLGNATITPFLYSLFALTLLVAAVLFLRYPPTPHQAFPLMIAAGFAAILVLFVLLQHTFSALLQPMATLDVTWLEQNIVPFLSLWVYLGAATYHLVSYDNETIH